MRRTSNKEDDATHHDGDEHPKDADDKHTTKTNDADTKSNKDDADPEIGTHASDFVKNNPESKEPPTAVDDLAERSPKQPYF